MVSLSEIDKENPDCFNSLYENAIDITLRISTNMPLSIHPVKHVTRLSFYGYGTRRLSNLCAVQSTAIGGKEYWSLSDMVKKGRIK